MKATTTKRKFLSLLLAALMVFSLLPVSAFAATVDDSYTPGTYTGTAQGYEGPVNVTVTLTKDGDKVAISDIQATGEEETASVWAKALALLDKIKENNGTDGVDAVSSATLSSNGIINATNEALSKASAMPTGSGTQSDPFVISNAAQLVKFAELVDAGNSYEGKYVTLGDDIDLSSVENFNPIGSEAESGTFFRGTFDGKGHSIKNLKIDVNITSGIGNYGLFSELGNQAVVKNLDVVDASVSVVSTGGNVRAGIIAAYTEKTATSGHGIIGARIDSCSATGSASAVSDSDKLTYAGGIAGMANIGTAITNCWTDASVSAVCSAPGSKNSMAGGIIGNSGNYVVLANCAAFGSVYGVTPNATNFGGMAGGIVGMMAGKQYNAYALGDVTNGNGGTSHTWIGALDGEVTASGMSKDDGYTTYPEQGAFRFGNYYASDAVLKMEIYSDNGKALSQTKTIDTVDRGYSSTMSTVDKAMVSTAMTKAAMQTADFAATLNSNIREINSILAAYGISGIALREWQLEDGKVLPTGSVWVSGEIDKDMFASGTGTAEDPYIIATAEQLAAFAGSLNDKIDYTDKFVKLGADITVTGEWSPIGGSNYLFNGSFDGNGHSISGLALGTKDNAYALDKENLYIGLFGVLGPKSVIKNVKVDVAFYTSYAATAYVGGIAGVMQGSTVSGNFTGAVIDNCAVSGVISHVADKGNQFVGGIVGMQYKGAVINSTSTINASAVVKSGDLVEVGGIAGLNNRGLVANCKADCVIYGSGNRENGNEGMAVVSSLVACNAGALVNSYASGDVSTEEHSTYAGMVSGWVTGIGKTYNCWFDLNSTMTLKLGDANPQKVSPVESIGTKVASGVNDEGDAYTGGLVDKMAGVNGADTATAAALNASFAAFPIEITAFGVASDSLKMWVYDNALGFGSEYSNVTYVQPECEKVVKPELKLLDGTWYGRDNDKKSVVSIEVKDGEIIKTTVVSGEDSGDAYDAALEKAKFKAIYGDFSNYAAADTGKFAGGSGTQEDPYLISNEAQLRYLSSSINADVNWNGVYFKQTANITLNGEWLPIGWALNGEVNGKKTAIAAYPFRGNYDGAGYTISGLTIGSADDPADQMSSGLFGLTSGSYSGNEVPTGDEQVVHLTGIHLKDISINVSTRYETYTGGLVGSGQNGIYIDDCSVTGKISVETSESFARAGGLAASVLRGAVTNSWADVDITAETDTNHVYAGGLYGMDNRVTTINCYALGNVTGNSTNNNKVHIGGLVGQGGGIHINCYAAGDVVSYKTTTDVGILTGRSAGISVERNCYYNTEAVLKQGDTVVSPAAAIGVNANDQAVVSNVVGKTTAELKSAEFAELLTANITDEEMAASTKVVNDALAAQADRGFTQANYYTGNTLFNWSSDGSSYAIIGDMISLEAPVIKAATAAGKPRISWSAVEGAITYQVYRSTDGENYSLLIETEKTLVTNTSAKIGTTYYYKVKAVSANGAESEFGNVKSVKCIPAAPAVKISTSAGHPKLSWNAVTGATKYYIYRSTDGKNYKYYTYTTKTSYTNTNTKIGTTYYYKVKAVAVVNDQNVSSIYSSVNSIQCRPSAPTVTISRSSGKPKLTWKAVTGASKYYIYRSTDGKTYKQYTTTTKTSYTNTGAASGKKYYYKVKAVAVVNKKNVFSAYSSAKNLMTTLAAPTVSITTVNGKPKVSWKAVTGADKYIVYRSTDGKSFKQLSTTTKTSLTNTGAKKNTKYYYKVKAVCTQNINASSAYSPVVNIKATK